MPRVDRSRPAVRRRPSLSLERLDERQLLSMLRLVIFPRCRQYSLIFNVLANSSHWGFLVRSQLQSTIRHKFEQLMASIKSPVRDKERPSQSSMPTANPTSRVMSTRSQPSSACPRWTGLKATRPYRSWCRPASLRPVFLRPALTGASRSPSTWSGSTRLPRMPTLT